MKNLIFIGLFLSMFVTNTAFPNWDLQIMMTQGTNVEVTITAISVPFEGLNRSDLGISQYNRVGLALNGEMHRRFNVNGLWRELPILKHSKDISWFPFKLASTFAENNSPSNLHFPFYGFAKYLITFNNVTNPHLSMSFIWNTLDSKLGNEVNGIVYRGDWFVNYFENGSNDAYIQITSESHPQVLEIVPLSQSGKEVKIWKLVYDNDEPWGREFFARSIPFPVSPETIDPNSETLLYEYILGTTVTFDTVYPELGQTDKYGYNTIMGVDYYDNLIIPTNQKGSHTFTPGVVSSYHFDNYELIYSCKIRATMNDTLIVSEDKHFWVNGTNTIYLGAIRGDTLIFETGSHLILKGDASLRAMEGGNIIDNGSSKEFSPGSFVTIKEESKLIIDGTNVTYPANTRIEIEADGYLILKDNATLIFDGVDAHLDIHPDANLILGENSRIEFRNGAYLDAENITFEGNNGAIWDGLVFHNAGGQTKIENCTLKNAKISIDIKNTNGCYANLEKKFVNNVFDQISSSTHLIKAENVFKILLQGNTFNIAPGKIGVEIYNTINAGDPFEVSGDGGEGGQSASLPCITSYALNFVNNTFKNGYAQLYLNCVASQVTPFWISGNSFSSTSGTTTGYSLVGRKVSSDIKSNNFGFSSQNSINTNILLMQSSVNMYHNNPMNANLQNILAGQGSNFKMAPVFQNNQWIWVGGYNNLASQTHNINIVSNNLYLPLLDKGKNCFSIPTSQGEYKSHIIGSKIPWNIAQHHVYYVRENSWTGWMGTNPVINLTNQNNQYITYYYLPSISCPSIGTDGYSIEDKGFGIYDTTYYTNSGGLPDFDEPQELYNQALYSYYENDFVTSIMSFKTLVQSYPESEYTHSSLYDIYDCYMSLDTSSDGTYRDQLYSDLKNFLGAIINAETHSEEFCQTAYEIILMCETQMEKYYDALTGYEFIAMYHPDPEVRFLASVDYAEIMDFMGGGEGSMDLSAEEKFMRLEKKLFNFIKGDPIARKLSKQFETKLNEKFVSKSSKESKELDSREVSSMSRHEKEDRIYSRSEKEIVNMSKTLLLNGRSISKEERRALVTEGIFLMAGLTSGDDLTESTISPSAYSLTQNYPNPFNPVTNISFSIPVEGLVKLKVYDITGREVAVLVNELKTPGSYNVSFNGSTLSSGVYFYRIEAGSFIETKRMVVLK